MKDLESNIELSIKLEQFVHGIQKERGLALGTLGRSGLNFKHDFQEQCHLNDQYFSSFYSNITLNNNIDIKNTIQDFAQIQEKRKDILNREAAELETFYLYTRYIQDLLSFVTSIAIPTTNSLLANKVNTFQSVLALKEYTGQERATIVSILSKREIALNDFIFLNSLLAKKDMVQAHLKFSLAKNHFIFQDKETIAKRIIELGPYKKIEINPKEAFYSISLRIDSLQNFENTISKEIMTLVTNQKNNARRLLITHLITTLSVLVFVAIFTAYLSKAYYALKSSKKNLEELNESKDTFFSIISHDLKAPFNALIGFSELLLSSYSEMSDAERLNLIQKINSASSNAHHLLEELLTWARFQMRKIDLNRELLLLKPMITSILSDIASTSSSKNITINCNVSDDLKVLADKNMLTFILRNIISNSIKFSFRESNIEIESKENPHKISITISDKGVGMTKEQVEKLFVINKVQSTTGTSGEKGTGLGLILCKDFIDKHEGDIYVESEKDSGTTFTITLPSLSGKVL